MSALTIRNYNPETGALEPDTLSFDVAADATGMSFAYQGKPLANHHDTAVFAAGSVIELAAPSGYTLSAVHEDDNGRQLSWDSATSGVSFKFESASTDPIEVEVTATPSAGDTSNPPKKKIHVQPKPGGALPDPQMQAAQQSAPAGSLEDRVAALEAQVSAQEARIDRLEHGSLERRVATLEARVAAHQARIDQLERG